MKHVNVKLSTYIDSVKKDNKKYPKVKVADHARISKYKNIFEKCYIPNWSEEVFLVIKVKNNFPWTYINTDLNGEKIVGTFYEKEFQKTTRKEFRIEKVIKRKGDKLCVKWKGYDNLVNI